MPVLDHEIHPSTQHGADFRYGCWNRPDKRKASYWAPQRRSFPDGSFDVISVRIPFTMSHDCRFDGKNGHAGEDPGCEGCRHYKQSDYVKSILENGQ